MMRPVCHRFIHIAFLFWILVATGCAGQLRSVPRIRNTGGIAYTAFPIVTPEQVGLHPRKIRIIGDQIEKWVKAGKVVGAEILIIKDRKVVLHEAFGWMDRERAIPMGLNTIFRIRSMSKPMIGTAILLLAEEGKLRLSDPVADYLPSFDNPRSRAITIWHLMAHRGGLDQPAYPDPITSYRTLEEAVDAVGQVGPVVSPGTRFIYSDAGTATLGRIVAAIAGMPVEDFIGKRVFDPLDMRDTFCSLDDRDPVRKRISCTYKWDRPGLFVKYWDNRAPQRMQFFRASGGVYASVMDYAKFLAMWMERGRVGSRQLLSTSFVDMALRPISRSDSKGFHYGLQWVVYPTEGSSQKKDPTQLPAFGHGGSDGTIAWVIPKHNLMVLYFTQSRGGETREKIKGVLKRHLYYFDLS